MAADTKNIRLVSPDGESSIDLNTETDMVEVTRFKAIGWVEKGRAGSEEGKVRTQ